MLKMCYNFSVVPGSLIRGVNLQVSFSGASNFLLPLVYLHLLVISANRAFAVCIPLHYDRVWFMKSCLCATASSWVASLLWWLLFTYTPALSGGSGQSGGKLAMHCCVAATVVVYSAAILVLLYRMLARRGMHGIEGL